jgi:hypothetical protein
MLEHVADVPATQRTQSVGIAGAPEVADVECNARGWRKRERPRGARLENHREQLEQRALAGAGLADQRDLRAALDV